MLQCQNLTIWFSWFATRGKQGLVTTFSKIMAAKRFPMIRREGCERCLHGELDFKTWMHHFPSSKPTFVISYLPTSTPRGWWHWTDLRLVNYYSEITLIFNPDMWHIVAHVNQVGTGVQTLCYNFTALQPQLFSAILELLIFREESWKSG